MEHIITICNTCQRILHDGDPHLSIKMYISRREQGFMGTRTVQNFHLCKACAKQAGIIGDNLQDIIPKNSGELLIDALERHVEEIAGDMIDEAVHNDA